MEGGVDTAVAVSGNGTLLGLQIAIVTTELSMLAGR